MAAPRRTSRRTWSDDQDYMREDHADITKYVKRDIKMETTSRGVWEPSTPAWQGIAPIYGDSVHPGSPCRCTTTNPLRSGQGAYPGR